jgi:hypothetical protein
LWLHSNTFWENARVEKSADHGPGILAAAHSFWNERRVQAGSFSATFALLSALYEFSRESTPARLRSRFGDADYDWDFRVNTTSGAVGWRDRLLGIFHSPYQPTEASLFHEMMGALQQNTQVNLEDFTFIDLGSGKGRTLLMASDYPFRRILGVELLPSLHQVAQENVAQYKSDSQRCFDMESRCADATAFPLPDGPLLIYLFNPFPESGLRRAIANLKQSLERHPRAAFVLYHNPQLENVLTDAGFLKKIAGTHQYTIFAVVR